MKPLNFLRYTIPAITIALLAQIHLLAADPALSGPSASPAATPDEFATTYKRANRWATQFEKAGFEVRGQAQGTTTGEGNTVTFHVPVKKGEDCFFALVWTGDAKEVSLIVENEIEEAIAKQNTPLAKEGVCAEWKSDYDGAATVKGFFKGKQDHLRWVTIQGRRPAKK